MSAAQVSGYMNRKLPFSSGELRFLQVIEISLGVTAPLWLYALFFPSDFGYLRGLILAPLLILGNLLLILSMAKNDPCLRRVLPIAFIAKLAAGGIYIFVVQQLFKGGDVLVYHEYGTRFAETFVATHEWCQYRFHLELCHGVIQHHRELDVSRNRTLCRIGLLGRISDLSSLLRQLEISESRTRGFATSFVPVDSFLVRNDRQGGPALLCDRTCHLRCGTTDAYTVAIGLRFSGPRILDSRFGAAARSRTPGCFDYGNLLLHEKCQWHPWDRNKDR
jgi:hypothetical protein